MNHLDQKINQHFAGLVVRKDLVKLVKGNAIVPSYVLEYLLGQYCATADEESIRSGIDMAKACVEAFLSTEFGGDRHARGHTPRARAARGARSRHGFRRVARWPRR